MDRRVQLAQARIPARCEWCGAGSPFLREVFMALGFDYSVQISDPDNLAASQQKALLKNVDATIANWAHYIGGAGSVDVQLIIDPRPDFGSASASATNITI